MLPASRSRENWLDRRIDTICVSGGSAKAQAADQDLYRGDIPNSLAHEPLETNRTRAFGGSTIVWGGRLVPFDPIDFETRDFLPLSGWPISYRDVARYIPQAAALCESRQCEYELQVEGDSSDLPATLSQGIVTNRCERWSMPTNFAERYSAELAQSDTVRVLIAQHCIEIVMDESRLRVLSVITCDLAAGLRGKFARRCSCWPAADWRTLDCCSLRGGKCDAESATRTTWSAVATWVTSPEPMGICV